MLYFDNAATTQPKQAVISEITRVLSTVYGNPSSTYELGRNAKAELEEARRVIANSINAKPSNIIFTSGGTESNTTALLSLAKSSDRRHIITTNVEHPSIVEVLKQLEKNGFSVTYLPVNNDGVVTVEQVKHAITEETAFVTIMAVNNETGAIQPVFEIAKVLQNGPIKFHTDAVQGFGVLPFDMANSGIDMMSVSGHKVHGPKGVGFLYVSDDVVLNPLIIGGGQERGLRSGTENLHNIVGLAKAVALLDVSQRIAHFKQLQTCLLNGLDEAKVPYVLNGSVNSNYKTPKIVNVYIKGVLSSKLLIQLDLAGIMVSAGSACSAGSLQPSRVLLNQYPNEDIRAKQSIRISFSEMTTVDDVLVLVEKIKVFTV